MVTRRTISRITNVSAFSHTEDHLREKTFHGGIVTLVGAVIAALLFFNECSRCLTVRLEQQMEVDTMKTDKMRVDFDITFPALPCQALRLDLGDVTGNFQTEGSVRIAHNGEIHKYQIDQFGKRGALAEYIPPTDPNFDNPFIIMLDEHDMEETRNAIQSHEGCNVQGWLEVQRVAGNIHFSVRPAAMLAVQEGPDVMAALTHRHQLLHGDSDHPEAGMLNVSHIIHTLRFGPSYPFQIQPLEGVSRIDRKATGIDKYFIKVVPTEYKSVWGKKLRTNQYSVTEYYSRLTPNAGIMPGVYFLYDMWPIAVTLQAQRLGVLHLLVRISAVVGGVWAVTKAMDGLVHRFVKEAKKIAYMGAAP